MPIVAGSDLHPVEVIGDSRQRLSTVAHLANRRIDGLPKRPRLLAAPPRHLLRIGALPSQNNPARLGRFERVFSSPGDFVALMLGKNGHELRHSFVGVGIVGRHELDAALDQIGDKSQVARQPIQLGDQQNRLFPPAQFERRLQLGPLAVLAGLDLAKAADDLAASAPGIILHGGDLGFQPQTGAPLLIGRDAVVGDEPRQ